MILVFDTSALRNIAYQQDTLALRNQLKVHGAAAWVPASVFFELENQAARLSTLPGNPVPGRYLAWLTAAWTAQDLGGGMLPFGVEQASALVTRLALEGPDWFVRQKATKVLEDAGPLIKKAVDAVYQRETWRPTRDHDPTAFKRDYWTEARNLVPSLTPRQLQQLDPPPSATIDWLHVAAALHLGARHVTDDTGIDATAFGSALKSKDLFNLLDLTWV